MEDILEWLESTARRAQPFKELLSQASPADRSNIEIPDELLKAWLHLVMSLVHCTDQPTRWEEQMQKASDLIDAGMKKVVQGLSNYSLSENSVLMPLEIASLVNLRALQDMTGARPDIGETYSGYLKMLVMVPCLA